LYIVHPLMLGNGSDEFRDPFACRRDSPEHDRTPFSHVSQRGIRPCKISFIDHDNVRHFQQPGFHRLHLIAETRRQHCDYGVGDINHV
jgi:hypothetical protein